MRKVLVVDDEAIVCNLIKRGLEAESNYDVSVCTDSREVFQVIKALRPDIILIDVNMPQLSGPQLVRQIRSDETTQKIPCIYMTGDLMPGEAMGVIRCIAKPFKRPELIALINEVLEGKANKSMEAPT